MTIENKLQRGKLWFDEIPNRSSYVEYDDLGRLIFWLYWNNDYNEHGYNKLDIIFIYTCWKSVKSICLMNIICK